MVTAVVSRALVLCVVVLTVACGDVRDDGGADKGPTPVQTKPPTPEATPDEEEAAGPPETAVGVLKAGSYQTAQFEPRATFKVGSGWRVNEESSNYVLLLRKPEPKMKAIFIDSSQRDLNVDEALQFANDAFTGTTGSQRGFNFSNDVPVGIGDFSDRGMTLTIKLEQLVVSPRSRRRPTRFVRVTSSVSTRSTSLAGLSIEEVVAFLKSSPLSVHEVERVTTPGPGVYAISG